MPPPLSAQAAETDSAPPAPRSCRLLRPTVHHPLAEPRRTRGPQSPAAPGGSERAVLRVIGRVARRARDRITLSDWGWSGLPGQLRAGVFGRAGQAWLVSRLAG